MSKEKGNIERYLEGDTKGMSSDEIGLVESFLKVAPMLSKNLSDVKWSHREFKNKQRKRLNAGHDSDWC